MAEGLVRFRVEQWSRGQVAGSAACATWLLFESSWFQTSLSSIDLSFLPPHGPAPTLLGLFSLSHLSTVSLCPPGPCPHFPTDPGSHLCFLSPVSYVWPPLQWTASGRPGRRGAAAASRVGVAASDGSASAPGLSLGEPPARAPRMSTDSVVPSDVLVRAFPLAY